MNKKDMIDVMSRSAVWEGRKDKNFLKNLSKKMTKQEIRDAYDMLGEAEAEYYENL